MAQKFRMKLADFETQHARIGDALESAKQSMRDGAGYRFKLKLVKDAYAKMGAMLDAAERTMNGTYAANAAVDTMEPRGLDSAIPHLDRLAPGVPALGENMDRLFKR